MTSKLAAWTEKDLANYIDTYVQKRYGRLLNMWFRAYIVNVQTNGNVYMCFVVRPGMTLQEGPYPCITPDYTPAVGDEVECVWRDQHTAYVLLPIAGTDPPLESGAATVNTTESTTTTATWLDLATAGPIVTVTTQTSAIVLLSVQYADSVASTANFAEVGYAVSGATAINAGGSNIMSDYAHYASVFETLTAVLYETGLNPGVNTFKMRYLQAAAGTMSMRSRTITVIPLSV